MIPIIPQNDAMTLNDGICPKCGAFIRIVEVAGTKRFLQDEAMMWEDAEAFGQREYMSGTQRVRNEIDGEISTVCERGHQHTVYHHLAGDWFTM